MRDFRKSSSYGIALPGDNPCSLRALRVRFAGSRIWSSGRASLSTGIILCIGISPSLPAPRRAATSQIQRLANSPLAVGLAEPELKLERFDIGTDELRFQKIM